MNIKDFIKEWLPETKSWNNICNFILDSGIKITSDKNPKWLSGYTNIGTSSKPHHKDKYKRYMEESMFMLHDVFHNIFSLDVRCSEKEYVQRQIYGELFTFYLTEWAIPNRWEQNLDYRKERGLYDMMIWILGFRPSNLNIIDHMYNVFIKEDYTESFKNHMIDKGFYDSLLKCTKMLQEDLENSKKNYKLVPKGLQTYCMVGPTSQNHIDFFEAVSKGAIKNIKREFNLELPKEWI